MLIGNGFYTKDQFEALHDYIVKKKKQYPKITNENIYGHYKVSDKLCPRFNVEEFKKGYFND